MSPGLQRVLSVTRTLHIYLSLLGLVLLLFFAVTGFMLLHKEWFGVDDSRSVPGPTGVLPGELIAARDEQGMEDYLRRSFHIRGERRKDDKLDFEQPEIFVSFDGPGQTTTVTLTRRDTGHTTDPDASTTGPAGGTSPVRDYDVSVKLETKSAAGLLADLHTGKFVGRAWRLCLDGAAILLMIASLTGLLIWLGIPKRRVLGLAAIIVSLAACAVVYLLLIP